MYIDVTLVSLFQCARVCQVVQVVPVTLTTNAASQQHVSWRDGDTPGMDDTQVGIFKNTDQISLGSFLLRHNSAALESQVSFEVLGDLTGESLERQFADQQLCGLLVATNLAQGQCQVCIGEVFFTPPFSGTLLRDALVASRLPGLVSTVDLRAVFLVRAILQVQVAALYGGF